MSLLLEALPYTETFFIPLVYFYVLSCGYLTLMSIDISPHHIVCLCNISCCVFTWCLCLIDHERVIISIVHCSGWFCTMTICFMFVYFIPHLNFVSNFTILMHFIAAFIWTVVSDCNLCYTCLAHHHFFAECSFPSRCGPSRCRKRWTQRKRVTWLSGIKTLGLQLNVTLGLEL